MMKKVGVLFNPSVPRAPLVAADIEAWLVDQGVGVWAGETVLGPSSIKLLAALNYWLSWVVMEPLCLEPGSRRLMRFRYLALI